jgi:hypothetical protein
VLHLSSPPSAASSRCVLLPAPAGHPYNVAVESFWIGGAVPFPSCRLGGMGPIWSVRNGVQRAGVRPDVRTLAYLGNTINQSIQ